MTNPNTSPSPALSKRSAPACSSVSFGIKSASPMFVLGGRQSSSGSSGLSSSQSAEEQQQHHLNRNKGQHKMLNGSSSDCKSKNVSRWMTQIERESLPGGRPSHAESSGIDQGSKSSSSTNPSPALDVKRRPMVPRRGGYSDSEAAVEYSDLDYDPRSEYLMGSYHPNPMEAINCQWDDDYSRSVSGPNSVSEGRGESDTEDVASSVYDNSPVFRPPSKRGNGNVSAPVVHRLT